MSYVIVGWIIGLTVFSLYAVSLVVRGRRLAAMVPPDRRRWMTSDD
ncbi:MAG: hypothetical protein ACR2QE_09325 [Acidimicrobiales bacterium]